MDSLILVMIHPMQKKRHPYDMWIVLIIEHDSGRLIAQTIMTSKYDAIDPLCLSAAAAVVAPVWQIKLEVENPP